MNSHDDDTQFWSEPARRTGRMRRTDRDATGQLRRTAHTGEFERTREHRVVRSRQLRETDATPIALSAFDYDLEDRYADLGRRDGADDAKWSALDDDGDVDTWLEPEEHPRRVARVAGVDPRLLRFGAIAAAAVVMVPVAITAAASDDGGRVAASPVAAEAPAAQSIAPTSTIPITAAVTNAVTTAGDNPADDDQQTAAAAGAEKPSLAAAGSQTTAEPACAGEYTVVAGDYWLRFGGTGASVDAWLEANDANLETNLFPGSELCIPAGAQAPAPPTTTAPPTTQPATTQAPTTQAPAVQAPAATQAPATTHPPTTQAPATTQPPAAPRPTARPTTRPPGSGGSVEQIIRDVWPDELEERALTIARRESNLRPDVRNYCCFGLFQIYYDVHVDWLPSVGVNSAEDLYDPYLNARAAYTLYQRSGGWGPWSQTDPGD